MYSVSVMDKPKSLCEYAAVRDDYGSGDARTGSAGERAAIVLKGSGGGRMVMYETPT